jgi:hypothetical protein
MTPGERDWFASAVPAMRKRAEKLGGTLDFQRCAGEFQVVLRIGERSASYRACRSMRAAFQAFLDAELSIASQLSASIAC